MGVRRRTIIICFPAPKQNRGGYRFKEYGAVGTVLTRLSVTQDIDWYRLGGQQSCSHSMTNGRTAAGTTGNINGLAVQLNVNFVITVENTEPKIYGL